MSVSIIPDLIKITGKYNLNQIWDRVLLNTPGLKTASPKVYVHINTNKHLQVDIGHSGHALNSEHGFRGS